MKKKEKDNRLALKVTEVCVTGSTGKRLNTEAETK
jgi:hypothetical protein